ncbi:MAG: RHS repeat-associated core domain-containing protein, partial [Chlamydiae bacterium]|nr:RHS repeat-associated core domain-containing protein [Chlamydiota bacterium]
DIYHFHDLVLTQLKRFVDHSWGKTPSLEYDGNGGFSSKDQESEIVDFYYQNRDGLNLLTHKKTANGISETHHYRDSGQRTLSELALKGKTIRAKSNKYNDLGLVECVVDYDPNTPIQKELWTTYNPFGQVLEQSQKSPTQHLITTAFSYDERQNIRTKSIYNGENRLIEVIEYNYDTFDRLILEKSSLGTGLELQYNDQNIISLKKDLETGLETTFVYDSQGQLMETITLRGSEKIVLDPFKRPIERIDIHNAKTVQKWGEDNKLLEVCLPQHNGPGQSIRYQYDALGYVKEEVDPDGNTIRYKNDLIGNKKEVMIGPYISFYEYNSLGKLTRQKIENRDVQEDVLDPLGRVIRSITPKKITSFIYSGFDIVQKKSSDGTMIDYTYDDLGRLVGEITKNGPFSSTKKTDYDPNGRATHIEFLEKGQHIFRIFDDRGRLLEERVEDSLQRIENHKKWTWGASDLLLVFEELIDGMWAKTTKNYDEVGREIGIQDPMGQKTVISYNDHFINEDHQEVVQMRKEFSNQTHEVTTLDPLGRISMVELFDPFKNLVKKDRYTRDFKGQVLTHTVDYQTTTGMESYQNAFKYNAGGKLIQKIKNAHTNNPQVFSYTYDSSGRLISQEKPDRVILTYTYNNSGDIVHQKSSDDTVEYRYNYDQDHRLVSVFNCLSQSCTDLKYSSDGLLVEERLENGQSIAMGYNSNAELTSFSSEIFGKVDYGYGSFGVESICYEYQNQTYPFQLTKTQGKGLLKKIAYPENSPSTTFDYNLSAQSIRKVHFGGYDYIAKFNSMGSPAKRWLKDFSGKTQLRYKYDGLDRLEKGSDEKEARTYNGLGILSFLGDKTILTDSKLKIKKVGSTLFQYDPQGNRSLKKDLETQTRYTFDALDRLTKIQTRSTTIFFQYDFKNRLVSKKIVKEGGGEEQIDYLFLGEVEIGSISRKTKELIDFRVVFQEPNKRSTHTLLALVQNRPVFVATDIFKNITSLIDPSENAPLAHVRFDAFGNQTATRGDFGLMSWMYQGKRWHPEIALYQFEHRFYDPTLAVFISCDPDGDKNGVDECRYALNNPLKYEDFGGLYPIDLSISIDFSSPVHRLLNLAYEGRDFTLGDFLSGLTLQTTLPLDTFCSTLKNTGSHLAKYLTNLIQKDRTRLENSASKNSSSLLLGPLDIDPVPPSYQFHPMIHRVTPDTKSQFNADGFIDIFMNGIWNSMDDATNASKAIANFLQKDVILVYNPMFGYFKDLFRAIGNKRSMKKGTAADLLLQITNHVMDLSS